jgi:histone deacetylase 6
MDLASSPRGNGGHAEYEAGDNGSEGRVALSAPSALKSPIVLPMSTEPLNLGDCNVGYVYSAEMMVHICLKGHPEEPERISRIFQAIKEVQYLARMRQLPIRMVSREEALLVHSEDHWDKVLGIQCKYSFQASIMPHLELGTKNAPVMTLEDIQRSEDYYDHLSLYVMGGTTRAARLSCGGVIEACLAVARNQVRKSFAIVRPPGHHAEPDEHMGFCFFNNVAVAAKVVQLLTPLKKIMILDWDVHHGKSLRFFLEPEA